MADWGFAHAATWAELLVVHDQWVADYNYQDHFAHRHRQEDRRSPAAVLHRVCGHLVDPAALHRAFYSTRFGRTLDQAGFARFRRWRVYAERGLAGEPVAVWLYAEYLTIVGKDEPLAQYRVAYQPDKRHLKTVTEAHRYETPYRSPQPPLWAWGDDEWLRVIRLSAYASRRPRAGSSVQLALFPVTPRHGPGDTGVHLPLAANRVRAAREVTRRLPPPSSAGERDHVTGQLCLDLPCGTGSLLLAPSGAVGGAAQIAPRRRQPAVSQVLLHLGQ